MTVIRTATLLSVLALGSTGLRAQGAPLELAATIELPAVKGRIDHLALDPEGNRLFVAALGNDTLEVVDVKAVQHERSVPGFGEPQDVRYVPRLDRIYVSNGSADRLDILDGTSLARIKTVEGLKDADNLRYEVATGRVYVGYGKGAIRILDAESGKSVADIRLAGHPESFALEGRGTRIFANVPPARQVAVVDRAKGSVVATWAVPGAAANYPMALDEDARRLFVGARKPALLLVYDTESGRVVARQPIGGDVDDIFFDAARKLLYVICGEGRIDVIRQDDPDHYSPVARVPTAPGARTGLLVTETGMLYVAAPARASSPARLLGYRLR